MFEKTKSFVKNPHPTMLVRRPVSHPNEIWPRNFEFSGTVSEKEHRLRRYVAFLAVFIERRHPRTVDSSVHWPSTES